MTANTIYLHDALCKRIAKGETTPRDLSVLNQLLVCQRRRCLLLGLTVGISVISLIEATVLVAL